MSDIKSTPLCDLHIAGGAKMVPFAGWSMPLNYGSQIAEHHAVREKAGIFDVSHMTVIELTSESGIAGPLAMLRRLLASDVGRLEPFQAQYGLMLNETGGVVDDLIVYRFEDKMRCVFNAGTRARVLDWLTAHTDSEVVVTELPLSIIAVQGPEAQAILAGALKEVTGSSLELPKPFRFSTHDGIQIAATGYTGEAGFELICASEQSPEIWRALEAQGATPVGLAARDSLRLEAGFPLFGQDLDEAHSPWESGVGWTIHLEPSERQFIGREALTAAKEEQSFKFVGVVLTDKGVLRPDFEVNTAAGTGVLTSGSFSPTMSQSIGLARVPLSAEGDCTVSIRGQDKRARLVAPVFVRHGKVRVTQV